MGIFLRKMVLSRRLDRCRHLSFDGKVIDCKGLYLSPGFVDIHTRGSGGHDYVDGSVEAFIQAAKAHMKFGATTICRPLLSSTDEHLYRPFKDFKAKATSRRGCRTCRVSTWRTLFCLKGKGAMEERHLRCRTLNTIYRFWKPAKG